MTKGHGMLAATAVICITVAFAAFAFAFERNTSPGALLFPLPIEDLKGLRNSFSEKRGEHTHEAVDIMAARGTPVYAVADGKVEKLFFSVAGGNTIYQFDSTGTLAYYYAHLDRYAEGIVEGAQVRCGDVIGYVGSTGNAAPKAPHLHFAIFKLGPERKWWKGEAIDPYPLLGGATLPR